MLAKEKDTLDAVIAAVHAMGKRIRFWNAPDTTNAWQQLMQLGVDYINTDHVEASANFMRQLPKR
jgi:alkaline phosphatase